MAKVIDIYKRGDKSKTLDVLKKYNIRPMDLSCYAMIYDNYIKQTKITNKAMERFSNVCIECKISDNTARKAVRIMSSII